ncbi:hypothetical protein [Methylocystis heyeri]|uniref:SGNH/GDSL hydrolase family protein n=1 Tax=Methylocystis heyeri TaxID=391905 RepID=A0A6B8K9D5_9HYPH|nr:hypothetical protein [Methylocystis heyeri]QGM44894.1 hypothetical protein H2LOC_003880 [Methylocystis heyeri]
MSADDGQPRQNTPALPGAGRILVAAAILFACGVSKAAADADGGQAAWKDPYPPLPAANDPAVVGSKWRVGSMVHGDPLEYLARIPEGDTTNMPVIVVGDADNDGRYMSPRLYDGAIVVYIGPSPASSGSEAHNAWLLPRPESLGGPDCSPTCPPWMFVPAEAIRDVLTDLAKHVRFAHDRVQMFAHNYTKYGIYRALDPVLQPYFSGVAHGIYAEWQQATCPDVARPTASPPRVFFSWGKCDQSFCATMECKKTLESYGYVIDPASKGDTTLESCPCPGAARRPHLLGAGAQIHEATFDWLLSNVREQPKPQSSDDAPGPSESGRAGAPSDRTESPGR